MASVVVRVWFIGAAAAGILAAAGAQISAAETADPAARSVVDGVYSEQQRRRGASTYMKECSSCHGETLRGGESSPPLMGADFRMRWNGHTLRELFDKMRLMPPNEPGKLSVEQAADVIAVVLGANGFLAGATDLSTDPQQLQQVQFVDPQP